LVEWLDQGGGVGWQEDDIDIEMEHLQHLGVARSVVHQQEDLEGEDLYCQVPLHLRDKTVVEPIHKYGSCYPCLSVGPPKSRQSFLVFALESVWV